MWVLQKRENIEDTLSRYIREAKTQVLRVTKPLKETLLRAKLQIVKQAGHGAYLDKPNEFNELLLDFISKAV